MKKLFLNKLLKIRPYIFLPLYFFDTVVGNKSNISIFCYHGVSNDSWKYNVSFEALKKQIELLEKSCEFIDLKDVEDYLKSKKVIKKPSVVITFDDGYKDILQTKKFFAQKNIKPTLFVLSDTSRANRIELDNHKQFLNKKEILELKKNGWTIGSHSETHSDFHSLTSKEIDREIIKSKEKLEKWLGLHIEYFAYPKGRYNKEVLQAVKKAGYSLGLSMNSHHITTTTNALTVPRVGVDNTHSLLEFRGIFSPSVITAKNIAKKIIGRIL